MARLAALARSFNKLSSKNRPVEASSALVASSKISNSCQTQRKSKEIKGRHKDISLSAMCFLHFQAFESTGSSSFLIPLPSSSSSFYTHFTSFYMVFHVILKLRTFHPF